MTLQDYRNMVAKFNNLSFRQKLLFLKANADILTLGSDGNCWVVRPIDKEIENDLYQEGKTFQIKKEWYYNEICVLVELLGLENNDI